jgi:hypothetical protein
MINQQEQKHDYLVDSLEFRLKSKGRYALVGREVPVYGYSDGYRLLFQPDVLTVDKCNQRMVYWEVKSGSHKHGYKRARKQAEVFYSEFRKQESLYSWTPLFVYYNPTAGKVLRIKEYER